MGFICDASYAAVEQRGRDFQAIFAHGEIERCAIGVLSAHERRIFRHQPPHRLHVAGAASAEQFPDIRARAGAPHERFVLLERLGLDHVLRPSAPSILD